MKWRVGKMSVSEITIDKMFVDEMTAAKTAYCEQNKKDRKY